MPMQTLFGIISVNDKGSPAKHKWQHYLLTKCNGYVWVSRRGDPYSTISLCHKHIHLKTICTVCTYSTHPHFVPNKCLYWSLLLNLFDICRHSHAILSRFENFSIQSLVQQWSIPCPLNLYNLHNIFSFYCYSHTRPDHWTCEYMFWLALI